MKDQCDCRHLYMAQLVFMAKGFLKNVTLFALNNTISLYEFKYKKETVLCTQHLPLWIAVLHYLLLSLIIIS